MLRNPVSILCCEVVPHIRQYIISRHAVPELVQASEVVLRTGVPLGGGFLIPLPRQRKGMAVPHRTLSVGSCTNCFT